MATETRTYWQDGNGDPFSGGSFGYDSEWKDDDDNVESSATTRPGTAVTIDQAAYDALEGAYLAAWVAAATGGGSFYDDVVATEQALKASAKAKLVSGTPLTDAEAAIVTGAP